MKKMAFRLGHLIFRISFIWYDFWIGWYYDRMHGILYFTAIPMIVSEWQILPKNMKVR